MSYIYLASPYTHPTLSVMDQRYHEAVNALAWLLKQRKWTYSPIVHCHELARLHDLPRDHKFWEEYDHTMLLSAITLYILNIEGMWESKGVQGEAEFAEQERKPIFLLTPHDDTYIISRHHRSKVV